MKSIGFLVCFTLFAILPGCGSVSNDLNDTANNNFSEDTGTSGNLHDTDSNGPDADSAGKVDDSATASVAVDTGECIPQSMSCNGNMLMSCISGAWQQYDDCSFYGKKCTVLRGEFQCVAMTTGTDSDSVADDENDPVSSDESDSSVAVDSESGSAAVDADTDTGVITDTNPNWDEDTDSETVEYGECDGPDVDCYTECWQCAASSATCMPALEECMLDVSCASFFDCTDQVCCGGNDDCLTGDDWEDCFTTCAESANATEDTLALYTAIDKCIACDACAISCGQNESADFAMCADAGGMNTPDNPCYEEQAGEGETACFTWAGWGGPCATAVTNCKNDDDCEDLESCVNDTWEYDDWAERQEVCFEVAGTVAEALYWAFMQCIYCDACDEACARDAGTKRCDTYNGSIVDTDSDTGNGTGSDTGNDVEDNTCKHECSEHCMAIGGTVMTGTCPPDLRCCQMVN